MGDVVEIARQAEFQAGLRFGAIALAVGLVAGLLGKLRDRPPLPVAGVLFAAAALAGLADARSVPDGLVAGILFLAIGGLVDDLSTAPVYIRPVLAAPGLWVILSQVDLGPLEGAPLATAAMVLVGGTLASECDRRFEREALGPVLLAAAIAGVYLTVPDTEEALVLLGAALALAAGWPLRLARLGTAGSFAAVGVIAYAAVIGGRGRPSSVLGAALCLGVLAIEPLARLLRATSRRTRRHTGAKVVGTVLGIHAVLVLVASRVVGRPDDLRTAAGLAVAEAVVVLAVLIGTRARRLRARRS